MLTETKIRSTVKPEELSIDDYHVRVYYNIIKIEENIGQENEFIEYEYDIQIYKKNEYIKLIAKSNKSLEDGLTDTQLALCDIYEMMEV